MNRRGAGVAFCFLAGLLYSTRFIAAAIFGSGVQYIGPGLTVASVVSLIVGILYLLSAEFGSLDKFSKEWLISVDKDS